MRGGAKRDFFGTRQAILKRRGQNWIKPRAAGHIEREKGLPHQVVRRSHLGESKGRVEAETLWKGFDQLPSKMKFEME